MQFQGMDIPFSPDQELAYIQDRSSTVFPVTPAASKLTLPASRFAPLPPIEADHVDNGDRDALVSPRRDEHRHFEHVPLRTFGQTTAAEATPTSQEKGEEKPVIPDSSERMYRSKDLRARFEPDQISGGGKDGYTLSRGRNDESVDNQRTAVKERTLTLDM